MIGCSPPQVRQGGAQTQMIPLLPPPTSTPRLGQPRLHSPQVQAGEGLAASHCSLGWTGGIPGPLYNNR